MREAFVQRFRRPPVSLMVVGDLKLEGLKQRLEFGGGQIVQPAGTHRWLRQSSAILLATLADGPPPHENRKRDEPNAPQDVTQKVSEVGAGQAKRDGHPCQDEDR
jgi:hypothetical protein